MLAKIIKGEKNDTTNPVQRDEKITLQPTVQMANADPSARRNADLESTKSKSSYPKSTALGSRVYSKAHRKFANKGEQSVSNPRFAGYSVFPQQFDDYCDVDTYVLPKKERVFPSDLTTYYSYYLNGVGQYQSCQRQRLARGAGAALFIRSHQNRC